MRLHKRRRVDDVFEFIIIYASENRGITPPMKTIANGMGLSVSRIQYLMARLMAAGAIRYVDNTYSYKVVDSQWEPPPYSEISRG